MHANAYTHDNRTRTLALPQDTLLMALHPNAKNVLGPRNIAFLHGPDHKQLRKSFLALFTRKALGVSVQAVGGVHAMGCSAVRLKGCLCWCVRRAVAQLCGSAEIWGKGKGAHARAHERCLCSPSHVFVHMLLPSASPLSACSRSSPVSLVLVHLKVYVAKQDQVICEHLRSWLAQQGGSYESGGAFTEIRPHVQKLNAMTSQEVFVGEEGSRSSSGS